MPHGILERVAELRSEIATLRERNQEYVRQRSHSHHQVVLHKEREERLVAMLIELDELTKQIGVRIPACQL